MISKVLPNSATVAEFGDYRRFLQLSSNLATVHTGDWTGLNTEVLRRADIKRELMRTVITRQIRFVGHVLLQEWEQE